MQEVSDIYYSLSLNTDQLNVSGDFKKPLDDFWPGEHVIFFTRENNMFYLDNKSLELCLSVSRYKQIIIRSSSAIFGNRRLPS